MLKNVHCRPLPRGWTLGVSPNHHPLQSQGDSQHSQLSHTDLASHTRRLPGQWTDHVHSVHTVSADPYVAKCQRASVGRGSFAASPMKAFQDLPDSEQTPPMTTQCLVHRTMMPWRECCLRCICKGIILEGTSWKTLYPADVDLRGSYLSESHLSPSAGWVCLTEGSLRCCHTPVGGRKMNAGIKPIAI